MSTNKTQSPSPGGLGGANAGSKGGSHNYMMRNLMILGQIEKNTDQLETVLSQLLTALGSSRTPRLTRSTGTGSIAVVSYSFSITNVGGANATVLGKTLKPGESIQFPESLNNFFAANSITYNGTGTELVITYTS